MTKLNEESRLAAYALRDEGGLDDEALAGRLEAGKAIVVDTQILRDAVVALQYARGHVSGYPSERASERNLPKIDGPLQRLQTALGERAP